MREVSVLLLHHVETCGFWRILPARYHLPKGLFKDNQLIANWDVLEVLSGFRKFSSLSISG